MERWIAALDNWETCDQLAANVAGAIVAHNPSLIDKLVTLTRSPNLWCRRFAVATAAKLNQRGRDFPQGTLRVCAQLLDDRERMVQKAVGWALREASKSDEALVYAFLREEKARTHSRILAEGSEKLTAAHRKALLGQDR